MRDDDSDNFQRIRGIDETPCDQISVLDVFAAKREDFRRSDGQTGDEAYGFQRGFTPFKLIFRVVNDSVDVSRSANVPVTRSINPCKPM